MFYEHGSDGFAVSNIVSCFLVEQWNLVDTVNNGPKKIVRINEGFFFTRNVWPFCQVAKKGAVKRGDHITKVAVRRGSTVLKFLDFQHVFQLTILDFACKYIIKRDAHGSVQTPPKSGCLIHEKSFILVSFTTDKTYKSCKAISLENTLLDSRKMLLMFRNLGRGRK